MKMVETDFILNISVYVFLKQAYVFVIFSSYTICAHVFKREREKDYDHI